MRHEIAALERLRGVPGIAQLAEAPQYPGAIMLADAGAADLVSRAMLLAAGELAGLAVGLGRAVAGCTGGG